MDDDLRHKLEEIFKTQLENVSNKSLVSGCKIVASGILDMVNDPANTDKEKLNNIQVFCQKIAQVGNNKKGNDA